MAASSVFLRSPLTRQPRLLARRARLHLGLCADRIKLQESPPLELIYPAAWASALLGWLKNVPLAAAPHPFNKVFGQELDEELLLRMCREGALPGGSGLISDIKLAWDYSRGQPLFTNAAAGAGTLEACGAFLRRWIQANNDVNGPTWTCAMEAAIRAANWIFADVLFEGELRRTFGSRDWAAWLWRHGAVVWRRLEARLITSNHYLADLLGLYIVGSIFPDNARARAWRGFAEREFVLELLAKTHPDGSLNEASLRYHAYVTEMALLFRLAQARPFPENAENRLRQMCQIVADFRDASGDVFALGDDDSGRVLALDSASQMGRAEILLKLANSLLGMEFESSSTAVYGNGGWSIRRAGEFAVALDFGGVGLHGRGGHAHNDDFSFCMNWRSKSVIVDPGTYIYTGDPAARNQFRSTWYHNTVILDNQEQRPLGNDVFGLPGPEMPFLARPFDPGWMFQRRLAPAIEHIRRLTVQNEAVFVEDVVEGRGQHTLDWRFHLHPCVQTHLEGHTFLLSIPQIGSLTLEPVSPGPPTTGASWFKLLATEYSPGYGQRQPTSACAASLEVTLPFKLRWQLKPATI